MIDLKFMNYKSLSIPLILISTLSFLLSGPVFAAPIEPQDFVYLFHFYYDNDQLVADRDAQFKYDVIPETFVPETLNTRFPYKGEIINLKGEVAETFQFDPRRGDPSFLKGKISVKAPYVPDGQKVIFYDTQGGTLLSIFVSDSSFCDDNGVCNADTGENKETCPNDCKATVVVNSPEPSSGGGQSGMVKGIFYLIIGVVIVGGWFGWRWYKKRQRPLPLPQLSDESNVK